MVKFGHIADVHLGGWKQEPMNELNFKSFQKALDICFENKVDFVLFAGDLFDSAYPSIDTLKSTFAEFKRLKDARIPSFIIAGSHDYSVSGKTFLDVLEKAGFCKNVFLPELKGEQLYLNPHIHENVAIYGYPGKKSGMEVKDLRKLKLNDAPGLFKIFMFHSTISPVVEGLPVDSLDPLELPKADYYALGHIHVLYDKDGFVYPGPLFPNNFRELEDLENGHFVIFDSKSSSPIERINLPSKKIEKISVKIDDALIATEKIMGELSNRNFEDKIVLLRVYGEISKGKSSDIKFQKIEEYVKSRKAYFFLKNTHDLKTSEEDFDFYSHEKSSDNIEKETIEVYSNENPSDFNKLIPELMEAMSLEKQEDEKTEVFNTRLFGGVRRLLEF
jgi:DNA repair exonuclease SbcCD nuclease subunit